MRDESFLGFLNQARPTPAELLEALRLHVQSLREEAFSNEAMRARLHETAAGPEEVEQRIEQMRSDADALERAALRYFARAWGDPSQRESIRDAFAAARGPRRVRVRGGSPTGAAYAQAVTVLFALSLHGGTAAAGEGPAVLRRPDGGFEAAAASRPDPRWLQPRAREAFARDLPELLRAAAKKWVAYRGPDRVALGDTSAAVYQECLRRGYDPRELFVEWITPSAADVPEVYLSPRVDVGDAS